MFSKERLKEKRIELGLTQEQLGKAVGISKVSICDYEKGKDRPKLTHFESLADTLGVTMDYLMNRDIPIVCEEAKEYQFKITKQELKLIQKLRKDPKSYQKICEKMNIDM